MDALAEWQLSKKSKKEAATREKEAQSTKVKAADDEKKVAKLLGLPETPTEVFAIGLDASAAVWWIFDPMVDNNFHALTTEEKRSLRWEVRRYRSDVILAQQDPSARHEQQWQYKGSTFFDGLEEDVHQVQIAELSQNYEYRFTVKVTSTSKGTSLESSPSNAVFIEDVLPDGWHRFFDPQRYRYYYASLRTQRAARQRPDHHDPFFLPDDLYKLFSAREIAYLRSLFEEELLHFHSIQADLFPDLCRELGERCTKRQAKQLFLLFNTGLNGAEIGQMIQEYNGDNGAIIPTEGESKGGKAKGGGGGGRGKGQQMQIDKKKDKAKKSSKVTPASAIGLSSLKQRDPFLTTDYAIFMRILAHLKAQQQQPFTCYRALCLQPWRHLTHRLHRLRLYWSLGSKERVRLVVRPDGSSVLQSDRLGIWEKVYAPLIQRYFYRDRATGQCQWSMPDSVRYYLPLALAHRMQKVFDPRQVQELREAFALLDIDGSGDLSEDELTLLLRAMGLLQPIEPGGGLGGEGGGDNSISTLGGGQGKTKDERAILQRLLKVADRDGSGVVEFDEFCWLMCELAREIPHLSTKQQRLTREKSERGGGSRMRSESLDDSNHSGRYSQRRSNSNRRVVMAEGSTSAATGAAAGTGELVDSQMTLTALQRAVSGIRKEQMSGLSSSLSFKSGKVEPVSPGHQQPLTSILKSTNSSSKLLDDRSVASGKSKRLKKPGSRRGGKREEDIEEEEDEEDNVTKSRGQINTGGYFPHGKHCFCGCRRF